MDEAKAAVGWRMCMGGGGGGRPPRERAWFFCNLHIGIRADDFSTCVRMCMFVGMHVCFL